jgi:quercetin dioxygenase-like cupin family protein
MKEKVMAIPHARSGEVVSVRPLGRRLAESRTETLIKTDALEVIRLVAPAGKKFDEHRVPGEITVQCLEGAVELKVGGAGRRLSAGEMAYLEGSTPHAVQAIEDASVLLTILLSPASKQV